jgi:multidrug efflux pump subunit AcrA (membrane-fusion protein)
MRGTIAVVSSRREDRERVVRAVGKVFLVVDAEPADGLSSSALIVVAEERAGDLLAALGEAPPPIVVVGEPTAAVDPRLSHVIRRELPIDQLRALLLSLAERRALFAQAAPAPQSEADARRLQQAFALSRRLAAAHDLGATERLAADAVAELVGADRAACLFHDGGDGSLWSEERMRSADGDERRAVGGLVGFVARTGLPAAAERFGDDPRALLAIDDPDGDPAAHLWAHPVIGARGQVHAVLVATRGSRRPPPGESERALLGAFAGMIAPFLDQLSAQIETQALLETPGEEPLFRQEALDAQALPRWGDVIRVTPSWVSWAYWVLLVLIAGSLVYVSIGTVSTYSAGPAIVRSTTRQDVTARTPGNVTAVHVGPGDPVAAGEVVARLDDSDARGAVDRLEREFETQLRNRMLDPADGAADAALRSLRLELDRSRLALEERLVRAPVAGVVADVRIRGGQRVDPGDLLLSIADGSGGLEVVALLPGSDRPQLETGMPLRLELLGYRYTYQTLAIDSVSVDVLAPAEARRVLGPQLADGLPLASSVVLVRARMPTTEFQVDDRTYRYHDGMQGRAEVRVRQERILYTLVPGLRRL